MGYYCQTSFKYQLIPICITNNISNFELSNMTYTIKSVLIRQHFHYNDISKRQYDMFDIADNIQHRPIPMPTLTIKTLVRIMNLSIISM